MAMSTAASQLYERTKQQLSSSSDRSFVEPEQKPDPATEEIDSEYLDQLMVEEGAIDEPTTPIPMPETGYTPTSPETKTAIPLAPEDEDVPPEIVDEAMMESIANLPREEQVKYAQAVTPNEDGLTPDDVDALIEDAAPETVMKINLDGLTVDNVFENNQEWLDSLIPGPTGLQYAVDVTKGIFTGIRDGLIEGAHFVGEHLYGLDPKSFYVGELDFKTETKAGEITSGISRFLTGYAVWGAPMAGMGGALGLSSALSRYLMDGVVRGSMGDILVTSRERGDQTIIGQIAPDSDNFIIQALRIDPDDSEWSAKMNIAFEGAILGTALNGLFDAGKWAYQAHHSRTLGGAIEDAFKLSDDLFNPNRELRFDLEVPDSHVGAGLHEAAKPTGQKLMDDLQRGQASEIVEAKTRVLNQRKADFEVKEYRLSHKERQSVRKETKQSLNVAQRDLKEIDKIIKTRQAEIEEMVKELERHVDFAENVGGVKGIVDDVPAERALKEEAAAEVKATGKLDVYEPMPKDVPPGTLLPDRVGGPEVGDEWANRFFQLRDRIQRSEEKLGLMLENRDSLHQSILESQYLLREIADEVQLEAAIRRGLANRLDLTPRYSQVTLEDTIPLGYKISDDGLRVMMEGKLPGGKLSPLGSEGLKHSRVPKNTMRGAASKMTGKANPLEEAKVGRTTETRPYPTTQYDAMVEDLFYKPRPVSIADKVVNRIRKAGSYFIYRSTDALKSLAEVSPTAGKLANMMRHDAVHMGPEAGQYGYSESVQYMIGKFRTKVTDAFAQLDQQYKTYTGKLTPEANQMIYNYMNGIRKEEIPENVAKVGQELRNILDEFHGQVDEVSPYIEDFFPRYYNQRVIYKNEEAFRQLLARDGYTDKMRQTEILEKIEGEIKAELNIGDLHKAPGRRFAMRGAKILSGGSRTLELNIENYGKFVNTDVADVLTKYIERGSQKVTYANMFGYNGEKAEAMLEAIQAEARAAGRKVSDYEIDTISRILQNIQGLRKLKMAPVQQTQEWVATGVRATLLNLATLSSLGEAGIPFTKARFRDATGGLLQAMANTPKHYFGKVLRGQPEAAAYEAAQAVGLATDLAASTRINTILGGGEILTGVNKKVNNAFFLANFLSEWVKFVQVAAFHTGRLKAINNLKAIEKYGQGVIVNHRAKELLEMGISVDEGLAWLKRGASVKDPFYTQIQRGALRFVDDTVIHPDATVKPGIQNSPYTMLITQLKAYPTGFANIVLRDWGEGIMRPWVNIAQDVVAGDLTAQTFKNEAFSSASKAARVATAVPLIYGGAYVGNEIKDLIKWGPDGNVEQPIRSEEDNFWHVMDMTGMLGHAAIYKHGKDAATFNQDPLYSWLGPVPNIGFKLTKGAFVETEGSFRDRAAAEAANLTRLPLPFEILWSLSLPDGTEQCRRNFKQWLASPDLAPSDFDPTELIPDDIKPALSDWEPFGFARRTYAPDKTEAQFMGDDDSYDPEVLEAVEDWKFGEDNEEMSKRRRQLLQDRIKSGQITIEEETDGDTGSGN